MEWQGNNRLRWSCRISNWNASINIYELLSAYHCTRNNPEDSSSTRCLVKVASSSGSSLVTHALIIVLKIPRTFPLPTMFSQGSVCTWVWTRLRYFSYAWIQKLSKYFIECQRDNRIRWPYWISDWDVSINIYELVSDILRHQKYSEHAPSPQCLVKVTPSSG